MLRSQSKSLMERAVLPWPCRVLKWILRHDLAGTASPETILLLSLLCRIDSADRTRSPFAAAQRHPNFMLTALSLGRRANLRDAAANPSRVETLDSPIRCRDTSPIARRQSSCGTVRKLNCYSREQGAGSKAEGRDPMSEVGGWRIRGVAVYTPRNFQPVRTPDRRDG